MKAVFLILCYLVLSEACIESAGADCWKNIRKPHPSRYSRCCRLSQRYKTLFKQRDRQKRQCRRVVVALNNKVDGLKEALNEQEIVVRVVPSNRRPPTVGELIEIRDRTVVLLQNAQFRNNTSTTPRPLKTTITTKRTKYPTTTTPTRTRSTMYPAADFNLKDDTESYSDIDEFVKENFENQGRAFDEDEEEDEGEMDGEKRRKRRMTQTSEPICPSPRDALSTISNLPPATIASFLSTRESLGSIDSNVVRSCAECHYQITLPDGYYPREHRHVICPASKINCFAGIGQCAKNEVLMTIFKDTNRDATQFDWDSKVNIIFNKGCGCQMLADYSFIGDGN